MNKWSSVHEEGERKITERMRNKDQKKKTKRECE